MINRQEYFNHLLEVYQMECYYEECEYLSTCDELSELYDYENGQLEQNIMVHV